MKTRKSGFYAAGIFAALTAVLFITAILVTSCLEPLPQIEFGKIPEEFADYQPAPGKGFVVLSVRDLKGRLINTDVEDASDFVSYELIVYTDSDTTSGAGIYDEGDDAQFINTEFPSGTWPMEITNLNFPLELPAGEYFFKLLAYQYDDTIVAATGVSALIDVEVDKGNAVPVTLTAVGTSGTGDGKFIYTFNLGAITTASLSITSLTGGSGSAGPINLAANNSGDVILPADFYRIIVSMSQSNHMNAFYSDVLYIYEGMSSTANITLPALKNIVYNLAFHFGDGRAPDPVTSVTATHGTLFGDTTTTGTFLFANPTYAAPTHNPPNLESLNFVAWYESQQDATDGTNPIDAAYVFIKNNLALYAGWTAGTVFNFSPSYAPDSANAPDVNASSSSVVQIQGNSNIVFTADNTLSEYDTFSWITQHDNTITENTNVFTLAIDNTPTGVQYKHEGTFWVDCTARHIATGLFVTTRTTITVTIAP